MVKDGKRQGYGSFYKAWLRREYLSIQRVMECNRLTFVIKITHTFRPFYVLLPPLRTSINSIAAISSYQSGVMLHARMQNLREFRFKTIVEHELHPQRLVDCIVTYNFNLRWDDSERLAKKQVYRFTDLCRDCHDEESYDNIERVELHNWDTDEESFHTDKYTLSNGLENNSNAEILVFVNLYQ